MFMENSEDRRMREMKEIEMMMEQARFRASIQRLNEQRTGQSSSSSSGGAGGGTLLNKISSTPTIDTGEVYLFSEAGGFMALPIEVLRFNTNTATSTILTNTGTTDFYGVSSTASDPFNGGVIILASDTDSDLDCLWRFSLEAENQYSITKVCELEDQGAATGNGIAINSENGDVIVLRPDKGSGKNYLKRISQDNGLMENILEFNIDINSYSFSRVCSSEKPGYVNLIYVPNVYVGGSPIQHYVFEVKIPNSSQLVNIDPNSYILEFSQYPIQSADVAANGTLYAFNPQVTSAFPFPSYPSGLTKLINGEAQTDFTDLGDYACIATVR